MGMGPPVGTQWVPSARRVPRRESSTRRRDSYRHAKSLDFPRATVSDFEPPLVLMPAAGSTSDMVRLQCARLGLAESSRDRGPTADSSRRCIGLQSLPSREGGPLLARDERRLAAILAADVAGYSRLMSVDESGTLARFNALRSELLDPKIAQFRGRPRNTNR